MTLPNRRAVGVDFGSKRIGIAICDAAGMVATPHETIKRIGDEKAEHGRIVEIVDAIEATAVIVGLPIDLEGDRGQAARTVEAETRRLTKKLRRPDRPAVAVHHQDERLSTVSADRSLAAMGLAGRSKTKAAKRKERVDQLAAATILQTWLDGQPSS